MKDRLDMGGDTFTEPYAKNYDLFYKDKSYGKESNRILEIVGIRNAGIGEEDDMLDVACGTGGHARYLSGYYNLCVQDASSAMYELAKKKLKKKVTYLGVHRMESFKHRRRFDVIYCLFNSIGYAPLDKTLRNFYRHLRPGGLVIFDFWNKEEIERILPGSRNNNYYRAERKCGGLYRTSYTQVADEEKQLVRIYIAFGKDKDYPEKDETHIVHYYSITQIMRAMQKVGFKSVQISAWSEDLWGILCVGKKFYAW